MACYIYIELDMADRPKEEDKVMSSLTNQTPSFRGVEKVTADFQCFVCGAIFNTDEDRKQHLEKEAHGELHGETSKEERKIAREQEKVNESHAHRV